MSEDLPAILSLLTPQQRRYVEARASGMSYSAAAKAAGIRTSPSVPFEQHPTVQFALRKMNEAAMSELVLTRRDVLNGMMDAVRAAASSTELVAAWREIGRIVGAYEPVKVAVTHEMLLPEELRVMTDRQLMLAAGIEGGRTFDAEFFLEGASEAASVEVSDDARTEHGTE